MIAIPNFQNESAQYKQRIDLDGELYYIRTQWNAREEAFYMSILDKDEVLLLAGVKLVPDYRLLYQFQGTPGLPPGDFMLSNISSEERLTFDGLGEDMVLMYITEAELNELQ